MIVRLTIIALLWLGSLVSYSPDYATLYARILEQLQLHQAQVVGYTLAGSVGLVAGVYILEQIRSFALVHLLARLAFEASQLAICLLSFAAVVLWFQLGRNLWVELGFLLASVPFMVLAASCLCLWIFDFNYPLHNRIMRNLTLPFLSLTIIFISILVR
ncbi:MAG: hypothetical protein M0017_07285 [Desulfobacteraceae bacterium]|nr:hypothetical protein [Desulfobacteraceae bacterium]